MPESTNEPPDRQYADSEAALGGADAVEKTTYVVGKGTDPRSRTPHGHPPSVGRSRGSLALWVSIVALLVALVYFMGIWR